jgi:3-hexulose-6-phosphate synthase/6-phospho-3-hexuloisomerase
VRTPEYGAPLVVLGAPLVIDPDAFKTASGDLASTLRLICDRVHAYGDVGPTDPTAPLDPQVQA